MAIKKYILIIPVLLILPFLTCLILAWQKATAIRYFKRKTLVSYDNDTTVLVVTGILKDVPSNSQIQFDALVPFSTIARPDWMNNWGGNWLNTYLELAPNVTSMA